MLLQFIFIVTVFSYKCDPQRAEYPLINEKYTLKYVQVLTRHGDRAPGSSYINDTGKFDCSIFDESHIYMNDGSKVSHTASSKRTKIDKENNPYATNYLWKGNCEPSQLTTEGIRQHFELGKEIKNIYYDQYKLLPKYFDDKKIKIRSTSKTRNIQSAQAFLQTFYSVNERKNVIDIEIATQPYEIETCVPNTKSCPQLSIVENELFEQFELEKMRNENTQFKESFDKLKRITHFTSHLKTIYDYVDLLTPRICHETDLPCNEEECMTEEDYNNLEQQLLLENEYLFHKNVSRFQVGFFVEEMLDDFNDAIKEEIVYQHYFIHDTTLWAILSLLGENTKFRIPYASALQFEYVEKDSVQYVRVLQNNEVLKLSNLCESNEDGFCTVDEFEQNLRIQIPDISECEIKEVTSNRKLSRKGWFTYH